MSEEDEVFNFKRQKAVNRTLRFWPELDREIQAIAREESARLEARKREAKRADHETERKRRRVKSADDDEERVTYTDVVMTFCAAMVEKYRRKHPRPPEAETRTNEDNVEVNPRRGSKSRE